MKKYRVHILIFVLISAVIACAALQEKYNIWYDNPKCTLFSDLEPPITDGFIYDKLKGKNPCGLEHGFIFLATGGVMLTKVTALEMKQWAMDGRAYLKEGLNGEQFIKFVSEGVKKFNGLLGTAVLWVGDGVKILPKEAFIDSGSAQIYDHIFLQVEKKMEELMVGGLSVKGIQAVYIEELRF
jgi:hypothetical protein